MRVEQLSLPARYAAQTQYQTLHARAQRASELLIQPEGENFPAQLDEVRSKALVNSLTEALCAARALDNLLAGNPPPKRGE